VGAKEGVGVAWVGGKEGVGVGGWVGGEEGVEVGAAPATVSMPTWSLFIHTSIRPVTYCTFIDSLAIRLFILQESVLGNMRSLDGLLGMMAKTSGGKGVVGKALEALQELFMTCLLPDR
jgi:hypothetical protein